MWAGVGGFGPGISALVFRAFALGFKVQGSTAEAYGSLSKLTLQAVRSQRPYYNYMAAGLF